MTRICPLPVDRRTRGYDMGRLATRGSLRRRPCLRPPAWFWRREAAGAARLVAGASAHIFGGCMTKCVAILQQPGGLVAAAAAEMG
jgi:hypothetical protein